MADEKGKSENSVAKSRGSEASTKKGKAPAKRPLPSASGESDKEQSSDLNNNLILECLKSIPNSQKSLAQRMNTFEQQCQPQYDDAYYDYDYDNYEGDDGPSSPKQHKTDEASTSSSASVEQTPSRFASLSKKFKPTEACSDDVDTYLANNINDLFRKGMDHELYDKTIKNENCPRPGNCDGLVAARMNKLVWDVMSQQSRTMDKMLHSVATSVVKAGVFITKTVHHAAKMEEKIPEGGKEEVDLSSLIEGCNDALALLGHANYQLNMPRRDLLRPELKREYAHLCTHSIPVTKELFGDDVSKTAKEIEDFAKIGLKMSGMQPRGGFRGRPMFRGRVRGPRGRGYGSGQQPARYMPDAVETKNLPRRWGAKPSARM